MKLPTDTHVSALFERLRRHLRPRPAGDTDTLATVAELERALLGVLRRARAGTLVLDATGVPAADAPASRLDATRGTGAIVVDGEDGWPDAVPATSVEIRALDHLEPYFARHMADPLDDDVFAAYGHLVEAVNHLGALQTRLALIARKASPLSRSDTGGAGACLCCEELVTGSATDRLKRGLCRACYEAWRRAGRPELTELQRLRRLAS